MAAPSSLSDDLLRHFLVMTYHRESPSQGEPGVAHDHGWLTGMWVLQGAGDTVQHRCERLLGHPLPVWSTVSENPVVDLDSLVFHTHYHGEDVAHYGEPTVSRNTALRACLDCIRDGGLLIWIDQVLPMYRKKEVTLLGQIGVLGGIDGPIRFRVACIFHKRPTPDTPRKQEGSPCPVPEPCTAPTGALLARRYAHAYPTRPRLRSAHGGQLCYGVWVIGNDYRNKTRFHGAYPASLLERYSHMLERCKEEKGHIAKKARPAASRVLHLFAGGLPPDESYVRFDMDPLRSDAVSGDAERLSDFFSPGGFDVIFADPPYSAKDASIYGNAHLVNRAAVLRQCAKVLAPSGFLVSLDCVSWTASGVDIPVELGIVALIAVSRSTNHRFRLVTFFQKQAAAA